MKSSRLFSIFILMTISLSAVGLSHSLWYDEIEIVGKAKMACVTIAITSQKVLTSADVRAYSTISPGTISDDKHTLSFTANNLKGCWFVWVGLVVQNQGSLPAVIKPPTITFEDADDISDHIEFNYYYYGPFPENTGYGNTELWGKIKVGETENLHPDGTIYFESYTENDPPFVMQPLEKAVIWIWIHVMDSIPQSAQGKVITMHVNIPDDMAI